MKVLPQGLVLAIKKNRLLFKTLGRLYYFGALGVSKAVFDIGSQVKKLFPGEDARALRALKGTCSGACFLVGNGPSLRAGDLDELAKKHIPCFASNRIDAIFSRSEWRPDYYICQDLNGIRFEKCHERVLPYNFGLYFFAKGAKKTVESSGETEGRNILYFRADVYNSLRGPNDCSTDVSIRVGSGSTVMYSAIQIAAYMGYEEIYLIGIDCDYPKVMGKDGIKIVSDKPSHFEGIDEIENMAYVYANVDGMVQAFQKAAVFAQKRGIKIFNATRGGKLEVFPRVDFDELMGQTQGWRT